MSHCHAVVVVGCYLRLMLIMMFSLLIATVERNYKQTTHKRMCTQCAYLFHESSNKKGNNWYHSYVMCRNLSSKDMFVCLIVSCFVSLPLFTRLPNYHHCKFVSMVVIMPIWRRPYDNYNVAHFDMQIFRWAMTKLRRGYHAGGSKTVFRISDQTLVQKTLTNSINCPIFELNMVFDSQMD